MASEKAVIVVVGGETEYKARVAEEAVIVVVGGETEYKARVAEALAKGRGASEAETTKGGVRIFRKASSPHAVVIDTTPLIPSDAPSLTEMAEEWVALNGLRRFYGKLICVICVLPSHGKKDSVHRGKFQIPGIEVVYRNTWLSLFGSIFEERKQNILILVKLLEGTNDKSGVTAVLQKDGYVKSNISFENMVAEDLIPTVRTTLERCGFQCNSSKEYSGSTIQFRLKHVTSTCHDAYGCWGPERVILLGRTGSGKSTLYQMLTKGRLDPSSQCPASSGIRGETKEVTRGEGRGWYVVDTPGFGEVNDKESTISTEEAQKRVRKYIEYIEGTYSHFIYVVMKDRLDVLDKMLWKFFQELFYGVQNFTVVVSNATETWVDQNREALQKEFSGCENFLSGEFPPTAANDAEWEGELEEVRGESLKHLEDDLASLARISTSYGWGDISAGSMHHSDSRRHEVHAMGIRITLESMRDTHKTLHIGSPELEAARVARKFRSLFDKLKRDKKIVLLPP